MDFDFTDLDAGLYFVKMEQDNHSIYRKLIIK